MAIWISPTTPVTMLIFEIFIGISAVSIELLLRETVDYMLAVNTDVEMQVEDVLMAAHAGGVAVAEDGIFQKLILISLTLAIEDVVAEDAVKIMVISLEEERIES